MTSDSALIERLRATERSGQFEHGGGSISSDGTCTSYGGKPIMRLRNPDGPEAAARLEALTTPPSRKEVQLLGDDLAASQERLRRLLVKYGDRIPLATNARPDWQQEIDDAFEWVANNPETALPELAAILSRKGEG